MSGHRTRGAPAPSRGWHWPDALVGALVAGIVYTSIARRGTIDCGRFAAAWLHRSPISDGADMLGNVFAYLLLGAAIAFAWSHRQPSGRLRSRSVPWAAGLLAVGAGALLSLSMETAQACFSERVSSAWDVLANTLGTALGWFVGRTLSTAWSSVARADAHGTQGRVLAVAMLAALAWVLAQTAPWVPVPDAALARRALQAAWSRLGSSPLDPWKAAAYGGGWLALGLALGLGMRRPLLALLPFGVLAVAVTGLRLLLPGGDPPAPELVATLPVAAIGMLLLAPFGSRPRAAFALAAALLAILAYQLEPGYGPPQSFLWRVALLHGNAVQGIQLAAYFGWFATTVVAAGHVLAGRALAWAAAAALVLALLEWAQTQVPGRVPDLSPPLIALVCAGLAAGMLGAPSGRRQR